MALTLAATMAPALAEGARASARHDDRCGEGRPLRSAFCDPVSAPLPGATRPAAGARAGGPASCIEALGRCPTWVARHTNPQGHRLDCAGWDSPRGVVADATSVYITGETCMDGPGYEMFTAAFNATDGSLRWFKTHRGPRGIIGGGGLDIAVSPDGARVYATGVHDVDSTSWIRADAVTIAYDGATGDVLWEATYNGVADLYDEWTQISVADDGARLYVGGLTWHATSKQTPVEGTPEGDYNAIVVALDAATGATEWLHEIDEPAPDSEENGMALARAGDRLYVGGYTAAGGATDFAAWGLRDDGASATPLWSGTHHRRAAEYPAIGGIAVGGGAVVLAGTSEVGPMVGPCGWEVEWTVAAFDASTGAKRWSESYGGSVRGDTEAKGVAISPDGGTAFVTGWATGTTPFGCEINGRTVAYDTADGTKRWATTAATPSITTQNLATTVTPDGAKVLVSGVEFYWASRLKGDARTTAYDAATGQQLWVARYNDSLAGMDLDVPYLIALAPGGDVVYPTGGFNHPVDGLPAQDFYEASILAYATA